MYVAGEHVRVCYGNNFIQPDMFVFVVYTAFGKVIIKDAVTGVGRGTFERYLVKDNLCRRLDRREKMRKLKYA